MALQNTPQHTVRWGHCIGCGVCPSVCGSNTLAMRETAGGELIPEEVNEACNDCTRCLKACPFMPGNRGEVALARELYGADPAGRVDPLLGRYRECFAGHVADEAMRLNSASGGLATWVLGEMLRAGLVDHVVCVAPVKGPDELFEFRICSDPDEVRACARSAYYPVEISGALQTIKSQPGRYAITALPCQAKALRLACRFDSVLRQRITYIVGLTCGQLKTRRFVDFAARLADVPGPVAHMSFRKKNAGRSAGQFSFAFEDVEGNTAELPFPGLHWNRRWFTPAACNVCDDMFAELADVSIMDAWLPEYVEDWRGTSIAVVRHAELHELLLRGAAEGHLSIAPIAAERVVASQSGAIRYKRAPLRWKVDKETARRFAGEKRHRPAGVRDWILLEPLRLRLLRAGQERSKRRFAECAGLSKEQMLKVLNGPERILLAMLARYTWWVQRAVRLMEIIWGKCRKRPAG